MELTRKQVIEILEKADSTVYKEPKTKTACALEYAINSLKTDEAYQLMYEGEDIYTRDDMVAMLEELKSEADELEDPKYILETSELPLDVDGTTLPLETYALQCYCRGGEEVLDIIENKINELKSESEE